MAAHAWPKAAFADHDKTEELVDARDKPEHHERELSLRGAPAFAEAKHRLRAGSERRGNPGCRAVSLDCLAFWVRNDERNSWMASLKRS